MTTPPRYTLGQLAEALGTSLDGDPARVVTGVASLETAGPDQVSFVTDPRYAPAARASRAGAFLAADDGTPLPAPALRSGEPRRALVNLLRLFHPVPVLVPGRHPTALVASSAAVDVTASVGPYAVVEEGARLEARVRVEAFGFIGAGARIGEDTWLRPRVTVGAGVRVGRRVILQAGAVIGADGFGYVLDGHAHIKIPQVGGVVLEDDVEVGANATIDRAMLGDTVIRRGTKVDNLVQIAHNVMIGEDCIVAGQAGIAGSARLGARVVLAGQVGIADHVTIGDDVVLTAQTGVPQDITTPGLYMGTPARPARQMRRIWAAREGLPELPRRLRAIEKRLGDVEARLGGAGQAPHAGG